MRRAVSSLASKRSAILLGSVLMALALVVTVGLAAAERSGALTE